MSRPTDIAHSRKRNLLIVTWEDGTATELPVPYLRGWCPCASCQGHGTTANFQEAPEGITAEGLFEMGSYALGIRFSDGHDTGIFTWDWFRAIAAESDPPGLKYGSFAGGIYRPPNPD